MTKTASEYVKIVNEHAKANQGDVIWQAWSRQKKIDRELIVADAKSDEQAIERATKAMTKTAEAKAAKAKDKAERAAAKEAKAKAKAKKKAEREKEREANKIAREKAKAEKARIREEKRKQMEEDIANGIRLGSVIDANRKREYGKEANNGDPVAIALKDAVTDQESLAAVAKENGIDASRWDHLNFGMRRMNLGNRIRGMINAHEAGKPDSPRPTIGGKAYGTKTPTKKADKKAA